MQGWASGSSKCGAFTNESWLMSFNRASINQWLHLSGEWDPIEVNHRLGHGREALLPAAVGVRGALNQSSLPLARFASSRH